MARAEIRSGSAAATALCAVVAGIAIIQRLGKNGKARGDAGDIQLVAGLFYKRLSASRLGWWHEHAIGRVWEVFFRAEDSDVGLDFVVVRRELFVGDWLVVAHPVGGVGAKISGPETERDTPPMVCSATLDA